ncbi:MAG: AIM24 family protein [Candidatus Dormibacteria bacterium]
MNPPQILPTRIHEGLAPGVTYLIEGELVPMLHCSLDGSMPVYFEHHVVLWKEPQVTIKLKAVRGAVRRMVAGRELFLTEARGHGGIAFSRDAPGQVFPLELPEGAAILVREHQFLAATASLRYSASHLRGLSNNLFGESGFWVDRFEAKGGDGVVWLHGFGNVFEKQLEAGEEIDVEPGGWVYMDPEVRMRPAVYGLRTARPCTSTFPARTDKKGGADPGRGSGGIRPSQPPRKPKRNADTGRQALSPAGRAPVPRGGPAPGRSTDANGGNRRREVNPLPSPQMRRRLWPRSPRRGWPGAAAGDGVAVASAHSAGSPQEKPKGGDPRSKPGTSPPSNHDNSGGRPLVIDPALGSAERPRTKNRPVPKPVAERAGAGPWDGAGRAARALSDVAWYLPRWITSRGTAQGRGRLGPEGPSAQPFARNPWSTGRRPATPHF